MLQSYIGKCVETGGLHQSFKLNSRVRLPVGAQLMGLWQSGFICTRLLSGDDVGSIPTGPT